MHHRIYLSVLFVVLLGKAAAALSLEECQEIFDKYGIVSQKCEALGISGKGPSPQAALPISATAAPEDSPRPSAQMGIKSGLLSKEQLQDNVFFSAGGTELDAVALELVGRLGLVLKSSVLKNTCVQLVGHSDESGPDSVNMVLSRQRAQAVAQILSQSIGQARVVSVTGVGEKSMLLNFPASHENQRRVEVRLRHCD